MAFYMIRFSVAIGGFVSSLRSQNNDNVFINIIPQAGVNTYVGVISTPEPQSGSFQQIQSLIQLMVLHY